MMSWWGAAPDLPGRHCTFLKSQRFWFLKYIRPYWFHTKDCRLGISIIQIRTYPHGPAHPTGAVQERKKQSWYFLTPDPAGNLLTLGKGPSWRLHIVSEHQAHQRLHSEATIHREETWVPTTWKRSLVLLESPNSHVGSLPELLEYPLTLPTCQTESKNATLGLVVESFLDP
jgi:hypothetical protein